MRNNLGITITFIFIIFWFELFCQENQNIKIVIEDTLVIKECRMDAIKLKVEIINSEMTSQNMFLCDFYNNVQGYPYIFNIESLEFYEKGNLGLIFIIKKPDGRIIPAKGQDNISYKKVKDEIAAMNRVYYVDTNNLKIKSKHSTNTYLDNFSSNALQLTGEKTKVNLFPMLNRYYNLEKGEYLISLFYVFNGAYVNSLSKLIIWNIDIPLYCKIFKGYIYSNDVKLIVK
jgi:hypothetical protein